MSILFRYLVRQQEQVAPFSQHLQHTQLTIQLLHRDLERNKKILIFLLALKP